MKILIPVILFLALSLPLHAHYIWLEQDGGNKAKAYFGEWHKELYEVTGGRLDNFKVDEIVPKGIVTATSRESDHVAIELKKNSDIAWIEAMAPRKSRNAEDITRGVLLARSGRTEAHALVPLDLVPQSPNSDHFVLTFEGQPAPHTDVTLYNPNREEIKFKTDAAGKVTLNTDLPGRYVVTTVIMDETAGSVNELPYDKTRYSLTLSFVSSQ